MPVVIDDDPKAKKTDEYYGKFIYLSEEIGDFIYGDKKISKIYTSLNIFLHKYIKFKPKKSVKKLQGAKISNEMSSYVKRERETRRTMGMGILSIIILSVIVVILYILDYIFSTLFDIMEWWIVAITVIGVVVPLLTALTYLIAKGDY